MEIWKDIKNYEGAYQVSNLGRVRSLTRTVDCKDGSQRNIKGRILVQLNNGNGYEKVSLRKDGGSIQFYTHRLVCEAFLPKVEGKNLVNHKNSNKSDNRLENLEWCDTSENAIHAVENNKIASGEDAYNSILTKEDVIWIRENYIPKHKEFGQGKLAKMFGVSGSAIGKIVRYQTWKF